VLWFEWMMMIAAVLIWFSGGGFEFDIICDWELEVVWVMAYVIMILQIDFVFGGGDFGYWIFGI
jgi:hypothetical protein